MDYSDDKPLSTVSSKNFKYVVLEMTLRKNMLGVSKSPSEQLEDAINEQASKGYRLHTLTSSIIGYDGFMTDESMKAIMVFEKCI